MRKLLLLTSGCWLTVFAAFGQAPMPEYKNTLRAGLDWFGLPESTGFHYQVQYARHLRNDRFVATASAGYMNARNPQSLVGSGVTLQGRPTKRVTFDVTVAYDFLPSKRHALRFGIGPSMWYREDETIYSGRYRIYSDGTVEVLNVNWKREQGVEVGGFGQFDYECYLNRRATVGLRLAFGGLTGHNGVISIGGATVGYRL